MIEDRKLHGAGGGSKPKPPTITPDNLISTDVVEFTLGVCEGPIAGLIKGPKSFYLDDTPLMSPGGDVNFTPFELNMYHGDASASVVRNVLGGTTSNTQVGVSLAQGTPVTRTTSPSLHGKLDKLEVRIVFNALVRLTDKGDQFNHTAQFSIRYRESGTTQWHNFFNGTSNLNVTGKTSGGYTKDFVKRVPRIENSWEIQVVKYNPDNDPFLKADMTWESFQSVTIEDRSYDNLAVVRGLGQASDQFSSIPKFTGVYGCKIIRVPSNYDPITRYYNGPWDGTFKLAHSDNPAWCLYDLMMDETYGLKYYYPYLKADRFSFYDAAKWCDEFVPRPGGGYQPRFTYNDKIDQPRGALELCFYIAGIFGGIPLSDLNGTVSLKVDRPGLPVQLFGLESVTAEGFQYSFTDVTTRPNDITVKFINPNLEFEQDVRQVYNQGLIDSQGRIPDEIVAIGCNDVYEAQRRAQRRLVQANTEVISVTFQTARAGLGLELFDPIGITDPHMRWGVSGRVKSQSGDTIYLRDPLYLPENTPLTMTLQTISGIHEIEVISEHPAATSLRITDGTWPSDVPDRAQFALSSSNIVGLVKPFRILKIDEDTQNPELLTITALEQNVNKYSDVDNMTLSDSVDYGYKDNIIPINPEILSVESGDGHVRFSDDGTINNRILVTLGYNPRDLPREFYVDYRDDPDRDFETVSNTEFEVYIPNASIGTEYEIRARVRGTNGKMSEFSQSVFHTVIADTIAPPTPTGWTAINNLGVVTFQGDPSPSSDFREFRFFGADDSSSAVTFVGRSSAATFAFSPGPSEEYTRYKVTAVDQAGNSSTMTDFIIPTKTGTIWYEDLEQRIQNDLDVAHDAAQAAVDVDHRVDDIISDMDDLNSDLLASVAAELDRVDGDIGQWAAEQLLLGVEIEGVRATLTQDYLTAVETDSAITASQNIMSAEISALRDEFPGFWIILDAMEKLDSGDNASLSGIVSVGQSDTIITTEDSLPGGSAGTVVEVPVTPALQFGGRRIKISILARKPSSNDADDFGIVYSTSDNGNSGLLTASEALASNWQWFNFYFDKPTPGNGGPDYVGIYGSLNADGKGTEVARIAIQVAAEAEELPEIEHLFGEIVDFKALDVDSNTAFGTMLQQLSVNANGQVAGIENFGSVMADLKGKTEAAYVLRAKAGGSGAGLEVVAWDNTTGGGSAITLDAENIFARGTLHANLLSVGNAAQMLLNSDYSQDELHIWKGGSRDLGASADISIIPPGGTGAGFSFPTLRLRSTHGSASSDGSTVVQFGPLNQDGTRRVGYPVDGDTWYEWQARLNGNRAKGDLKVLWFDVNGSPISDGSAETFDDPGGVDLDNPSKWIRYGGLVQSPSNAAYALPSVYITEETAGPDATVFIHQPFFGQTSEGTSLSVYGGNSTTVISGESILTPHLSAISTDIGTVTAGVIQSNDGKFVIDLNNKSITITV